MKIRDFLVNLLISGSKISGKDYSFYSALLLSMDIRSLSDNSNIPANTRACATLEGNKYVIYFDDDFFNGCTNEQKLGVCIHEIEHIIRKHLSKKWRALMPNHEFANVAMDCSINQDIPDNMLPHNRITLQNFTEMLNKAGFTGTVKPNESSIYYYNLMQQTANNMPMPENFDSHEGFGVDEIDAELAEALFDAKVKDIVESNAKARGTVPSHLESYIANLFKPEEAKIDWRRFLALFAQTVKTTNKRTTRMRPNRRYDDAKGFKKTRKCHLLYAVDTSGSVSDEELLECCNEMAALYKKGISFDVLHCDASIKEGAYAFTGTFKPFVGRGGTDFQPVIDYYNERSKEYDGLVFFTDGECSNPKNVQASKTLWIFSSVCRFNKDLDGIKTQITKNK